MYTILKNFDVNFKLDNWWSRNSIAIEFEGFKVIGSVPIQIPHNMMSSKKVPMLRDTQFCFSFDRKLSF